ncbi:MAG: YlxR family protein [Chthonomonadales bacterium]|nr:YlxR family protein [Chthonomonadales bacterium]
MTRGRHVPLRTCVGCRSSGDKRGLIRIARTPEGQICVDLTGKLAGRGAYVCCSPACITAAAKKKVLDRHLRQPVPAEIYDQLLQHASLRTRGESDEGAPDG